MQSQLLLRGMVMDAIADDYERLDSILIQVFEWAAAEGVEATRRDVINILTELITRGSAHAFLLLPSAAPVLVSEVLSAEEMEDVYFLLSSVGKKEIGLVPSFETTS